MRFILAILLNVIMPGTGLIVLGRLRTGLLSALLFTVCGELAVCGVFLSPGSIPPVVTIGSGAVAAGAWLLAQWMLKDRIGTLRDPALQHELAILREQAMAAIDRKEWQDAQGLLHIAMNIDPDSAETMVLWARLVTALGRFREGRKAWKRVINSGHEQYRREAITTLERLPKA